MQIPESFRRLFIRNAILENINVLESLITEAAGFISHKEKMKMKNTALQLSKVKETIKQQVGRRQLNASKNALIWIIQCGFISMPYRLKNFRNSRKNLEH